MKLKGMEIPPALPMSLRAVLSASGTTTPILSPTMAGSGISSPPTGILPPPMSGVPRPVVGGGMATPPLQPVAPVNMMNTGMMPPLAGAIPTAIVPNMMGGVNPAAANSVPPSSLAFRSATPPSSGTDLRTL